MFVILPQTFRLRYFFKQSSMIESSHSFSAFYIKLFIQWLNPSLMSFPPMSCSHWGVQTCPGQPCLHISIHSPLPQTSLSSVHASHVLKQESFYSDLTFNNPFLFFLILALTGVSLELEVLIYYVYPLSDWALDHRFCCLYSLYWVPRVP